MRTLQKGQMGVRRSMSGLGMAKINSCCVFDRLQIQILLCGLQDSDHSPHNALAAGVYILCDS